MDRPAPRCGPAAGTHRTLVLLRLVTCATLLGLGAACAANPPLTPASLATSRRLVSVTYPAPQTLHARAASRDSMLHRVTTVVGWPTAVRGDTLELQLAQWRADGHTYEMQPPDFTLAVLPETGATIRDHERGGTGTVIVVLLVMAGIVFGIAMGSMGDM